MLMTVSLPLVHINVTTVYHFTAINKPHPQLEESSGNGSSSDDDDKEEVIEKTTPQVLPAQLINSLPQGNQATAMLNLLTQMLLLQQKTAAVAATETPAATVSSPIQSIADSVCEMHQVEIYSRTRKTIRSVALQISAPSILSIKIRKIGVLCSTTQNNISELQSN